VVVTSSPSCVPSMHCWSCTTDPIVTLRVCMHLMQFKLHSTNDDHRDDMLDTDTGRGVIGMRLSES